MGFSSSPRGQNPDGAYQRQQQPDNSTLDDLQAQRQSLAQGLIRLDQEAGWNEPEAAAGKPGGPFAQPSANVSPGQALSQLRTLLAVRQRSWDADQLSAAARRLHQTGTRPLQDAFFYTSARMMNLISHAIEERLIIDQFAGDVYSGFQRLSLLKPQVRRYRGILLSARYVFLYGINDAPARSEVAALQHPRLIRLPTDQRLRTDLEWFWFVVVDSERLQTALLAQQLGGNLWSSEQRERSYTGLWTFNPTVIQEIIAILQRGGHALFHHTSDS